MSYKKLAKEILEALLWQGLDSYEAEVLRDDINRWNKILK